MQATCVVRCCGRVPAGQGGGIRVWCWRCCAEECVVMLAGAHAMRRRRQCCPRAAAVSVLEV